MTDRRRAVGLSVVLEGWGRTPQLNRYDIDAASRFRRDSGSGNLRVILPRMCRLPEPADYCHLNKWALGNSTFNNGLYFTRQKMAGKAVFAALLMRQAACDPTVQRLVRQLKLKLLVRV